MKKDINEAYLCGRTAVKLAKKGKTGLMVALVRRPGKTYRCTTGTIQLGEVAVHARPMPDEFINKEGNFVTDAFTRYLKPLVGDLPDYTKLCYRPFRK